MSAADHHHHDHAHGHAHSHGDAHTHTHTAVPALTLPAAARPAASLLTLSLGRRLAVIGGLAAVIWALTFWAMW